MQPAEAGYRPVPEKPTARTIPDIDCGDTVVRFIVDSIYLEQAGLHGQEYYDKIEADLQASRYSQHAAVFLLILLPNLETLKLPRRWNLNPVAPAKLINSVVRRAKWLDDLPSETSSLAQTGRMGLPVTFAQSSRFDLAWAAPFLGLPRMHTFWTHSCVAVHDRGVIESIPSFVGLRSSGCGFALEHVHFISSHIDASNIASFLEHTFNLRTLYYSHSTKEDLGPENEDWNFREFLTAINQQAGNQLEELHVSIRELRGSVPPGKISIRGFQRLRQLEIPLEVAICDIEGDGAPSWADTRSELSTGIAVDGSTEYKSSRSHSIMSINSLIPPSVIVLSLISNGTDEHAQVLDQTFQNFATQKSSTLPILETIYLTCHSQATVVYKEQCAILSTGLEGVGVVLHLKPRVSSDYMEWSGHM
ncbi:MAG: hypothetical protein Q9227_004711 [Pyrenula ochraceoflavens]